jgi:hypothetical protein
VPPQAVTSTADGDVVVWDEQGLSASNGARASDRHATKVGRLTIQLGWAAAARGRGSGISCEGSSNGNGSAWRIAAA